MCNNKMRLMLLVIFISLAIGQKMDLQSLGWDHDPTESCTTVNITCICEADSNGVNQTVPMRMERYVHTSATGSKTCNPVGDPHLICKRMSCELSPRDQEIFESPVVISIPGEGDYNVRRYARAPRGCPIRELRNANVSCWLWPEFVDCIIYCRYGYALDTPKGSMLSRNISCIRDENNWFPESFQDCDAYLNCKAHLIKPGNLHCKIPVIEPPFCEIGCHKFEGDEATNYTKYQCLDETFGSNLPHCVVMEKDVKLIAKPINQTHNGM